MDGKFATRRSGVRLDTHWNLFYLVGMSEAVEALPQVGKETEEKSKTGLEPGYLVVCWNDPVNFMEYVTLVFQTVFGWPRQKARFHMLQVHEQGKSVLVRESMEKAEHYVHQLQKFTLHATMERDE
jgi:ATP-dependent Clp protease adaptor protein ClpS